jgi:hypothetical protein
MALRDFCKKLIAWLGQQMRVWLRFVFIKWWHATGLLRGSLHAEIAGFSETFAEWTRVSGIMLATYECSMAGGIVPK